MVLEHQAPKKTENIRVRYGFSVHRTKILGTSDDLNTKPRNLLFQRPQTILCTSSERDPTPKHVRRNFGSRSVLKQDPTTRVHVKNKEHLPKSMNHDGSWSQLPILGTRNSLYIATQSPRSVGTWTLTTASGLPFKAPAVFVPSYWTFVALYPDGRQWAPVVPSWLMRLSNYFQLG